MADNVYITDPNDKHMNLLKFEINTDKGTCVVVGWNDIDGVSKVIDTINRDYDGKLSLNIKPSIRYNKIVYSVVGIAPSLLFSKKISMKKSLLFNCRKIAVKHE